MYRPPFVLIIAGFPRSGTTLLRTALRRHPDLDVLEHEPHYLPELYRRFGDVLTDVPAAVDFLIEHPTFPTQDVSPEALRHAFRSDGPLTSPAFLRTYFGLLFEGEHRLPLVVKLPRFIFDLGEAEQLFETIRVIHVIRDPRAAIASHIARWPQGRLWHRIETWKEAIRAGQAWHARHPDAYLEVRFEDLIHTPREQLGRICRFLGLPFREELLDLDYDLFQWSAERPGDAFVRHFDGFDASKVNRWERQLPRLDVKLIERRCRREMRALGYEPSNPSVPGVAYRARYLTEQFFYLLAAARRALS